jgi:prophage antirepressor-like protein
MRAAQTENSRRLDPAGATKGNAVQDLIPFTYEGTPVRVLQVDGEPWFVLADLCRVLDIANPRNVAARLDGDMKNSVRLADGTSGNPNVTTVNEPGMYEVIIRSDKPEAAAFRRWITTDVLPSIRRTGSYVAPQSREQQLAQAVLVAQQVIAETEARAIAAEAEVRELEPKADYVDTFVASEDLRILRHVAKNLGIQEQELRQLLINHKWIYQESQERWSNSENRKVTEYRYSPYAEKRQYFRAVVNHEAPRFHGELNHTLKVTPQGALAIARAVKTWTTKRKAA